MYVFTHGTRSAVVGSYLLAIVQCELLWRLARKIHHQMYKNDCHDSDNMAPYIDNHSV